MPAGLYSLVTILVCIVLAKLAGADYLAGIAEWVAHRQDTLSEMLHWVKPGTAHRTTYSRILGRILQIAEFEQVVRDFFAHPLRVRGSNSLWMVRPCAAPFPQDKRAAFLPGEGWVMAQAEVGAKEYEIPAAAPVLKCLDFRAKSSPAMLS